jgi:hypothetical protein
MQPVQWRDHPENNLANLSTLPDMKVFAKKKKPESLDCK